ncbi:MAG TPA: hypothetical protein VKU02_22190 [Gemmataceae bacterium]|nr:hypothetical protein [Gemmataceae bacterium]
MRREIDIYVQFRGNERLLRLRNTEGEWHAALMVTGKTDWLTEEYVNPAPRNAKLPIMELRDSTLRIEQPKDNVMSMEMGKLLAARGVSIAEGWIGVSVTSVMADYQDDIGDRHREGPSGEWGKILDFHAGAQQSRQKEDRGIER